MRAALINSNEEVGLRAIGTYRAESFRAVGPGAVVQLRQTAVVAAGNVAPLPRVTVMVVAAVGWRVRKGSGLYEGAHSVPGTYPPRVLRDAQRLIPVWESMGGERRERELINCVLKSRLLACCGANLPGRLRHIW